MRAAQSTGSNSPTFIWRAESPRATTTGACHIHGKACRSAAIGFCCSLRTGPAGSSFLNARLRSRRESEGGPVDLRTTTRLRIQPVSGRRYGQALEGVGHEGVQPPPGAERRTHFCLVAVGVMYTAVERIQISPLRVDGSRWNAGHCRLVRWAATQLPPPRGRNGVVQFHVAHQQRRSAVSKPYHYCPC